MTTSTSRSAVLTGDLVKSTDAGAELVTEALGRVQAQAATVSRWPGNDRDCFTRFRGDGWQFLIADPRFALRALVCVHAALKSVDALPLSRVSIGIGTIDPISGTDLSAASGSALIASGQALDTLEKSRLFCIAGDGVTPLHHAVIDLVEDQVMRWTPEQAEAALSFLSPRHPTQTSIAAALRISTQAVHARLKGAGAHALKRAVTAWEAEEYSDD